MSRSPEELELELIESQVKTLFGRKTVAMPAYSIIQKMKDLSTERPCYGIFSISPVIKEIMSDLTKTEESFPKYTHELWEGIILFLPKKKWKSGNYKGWSLEEIITIPIKEIKENSEKIEYEQ